MGENKKYITIQIINTFTILKKEHNFDAICFLGRVETLDESDV